LHYIFYLHVTKLYELYNNAVYVVILILRKDG